jgi:hypothetical protein
MGLDREAMKVSDAMKIAKEFYSKEGYDHAMRVAGYVAENMSIPHSYRDECVCLAIMHDLIEDTEYKGYSYLPGNFKKALLLLTKPKDMSYVDYCKKLRCIDNTNYAMCAYWVKLADMKDHLTLKETLTDNLKVKYLEGLAELL